MAIRVSTAVLTVLEPFEQTKISVVFDRKDLPPGAKLGFKCALQRLKNQGEFLVADVDTATVLIMNRANQRVSIDRDRVLGKADLIGFPSDDAIPTVQDAEVVRAHRPSKAIPIVKPPAIQDAQTTQSDRSPKTVPVPAMLKATPSAVAPPEAPPAVASPHETERPIPTKEQTQPKIGSNLDVYARPYVPNALRTINSLPAVAAPTAPLLRINFAQYVSSFAGYRFLPAMPSPVDLDREDTASAGRLFVDQLTARNYHQYWATTLAVEFSARNESNDESAMFDMPITYDHNRGILQLTVPGLAEGRLHVEVGDQVKLRQIPFTGIEHISNIVGIFRRQELLEIEYGRQFIPVGARLNVCFIGQRRREEALASALSSTCVSLKPDSWASKMLFPRAANCILQSKLDNAALFFKQFDPNLNVEQLQAIGTIKKRDYGTIPFLVDGPPGTGKSKLLTEAILQLEKEADGVFLVCAPSDSAADTLALRLSEYLLPGQLLRLNDPYRTFQEVPDKLLVFCSVEGERFSLPGFVELMKCRVVVTTCRDAYMLIEARLTNSDLAHAEHGFMASLYPGKPRHAPSLHWSGLIIDEAAQATELEALIPLRIVDPPDDIPLTTQHGPIVVMAGDAKQLNPRTASRTSAMETSLFARLLECEVYRSHPLARRNVGRHRPIVKQEMLPMLRPPFATLVRNYRSHPAILAVSSALFYNDTLLPEATDSTELMSLPGFWRGRGWPVLFCHNNGLDDVSREGGGWFNVSEAHKALQYVQKLLESSKGQINQKDIAIITPFQANVFLLRNLARSHRYNLWSVNIGPIEAFQGLESRVVILCTTRARSRFLEQDLKVGYGVIRESKRFNVAMTRARQGLIVIGNADLLATIDENWRVFLSFCHRNGLWEGEEKNEVIKRKLEKDDVPMYISRLEHALLDQYAEGGAGEERARRQLDDLRVKDIDEEVGMYASALAAEAALREVNDGP